MSGLKLLSWNMNQKASNWQTVLDSEVDAAMLQEAKNPLVEMASKFLAKEEVEPEVSGLPWRAIVAGLANNNKYDFTPIKTQPLGGSDPEALMVSRPGTLDAAVIRIKETGEEITILSLYSFWMNPIIQIGSSWIFADALGLRFVGPQAPEGGQAELWPEELLEDSLNVPTYHHNRQIPAGYIDVL